MVDSLGGKNRIKESAIEQLLNRTLPLVRLPSQVIPVRQPTCCTVGNYIAVTLHTERPGLCTQAFKPYEEQGLQESVKIESKLEDLVKAYDVGKPLVYDVVFDTAPEFTWKSSYREIKVLVCAFKCLGLPPCNRLAGCEGNNAVLVMHGLQGAMSY